MTAEELRDWETRLRVDEQLRRRISQEQWRQWKELLQKRAAEDVDGATLQLLAIVRNACAAAPEAQSAVSSVGMDALMVDLAHRFLGGSPSGCLSTNVRVAVQAISNCITGHPRNQCKLWSLLVHPPKDSMSPSDSLFCKVLAYRQDHRVPECAAIMLLNFLHDSPERCQELVGSEHGLQILRTLLQHSQQDDDTFPAPVVLLLERQQLLAQAFPLLDTPCRRAILRLIHAHIQGHEGEGEHILQLSTVTTLWNEWRTQYTSASFPGTLLEWKDDRWAEYMLALTAVLACPASCAVLLRQEKAELGFVDLLLDVLSKLLRAVPVRHRAETRCQQLLIEWKRETVKGLANVCFRNQAAQHRIRQSQGIPLLLSCCAFDDANPVLREWAMFAMRNVSHGNVENQQAIHKMSSGSR